MIRVMLALVLTSAPVAAEAKDMLLSDFLQKANKLEAAGSTATAHPDYARLSIEMNRVASVARAAQRRAAKNGEPVGYCLPKNKPAATSRQVMDHFRSIPAERHGITVREAYVELLRKEHPC